MAEQKVITKKDIEKIISNYDTSNLSIGTIGSHSALDVARGAKQEGYKSIVVALRGREKTYSYYNKADGEVGCVDKTIILDKWSDFTLERVLGELVSDNNIQIVNRSTQVYLGHHRLQTEFYVPTFGGNRKLWQAEERAGPFKIDLNQDKILEMAEIPTPQKFASPEEIDREVLVKTTAAVGERDFERKFLRVSSYAEYAQKRREAIAKGKAPEEQAKISSNFENAVIEEFLEGFKININYFYSYIRDKLEILGTDTRSQFPGGEELSHTPVSLRESLLEKAYEMGEKLVKTCREIPEFGRGIVGPFALQTIAKGNNELPVYDVSFRIPGSPDESPNTIYTYGMHVSYGRRIAMEIKEAIRKQRLMDVLT